MSDTRGGQRILVNQLYRSKIMLDSIMGGGGDLLGAVGGIVGGIFGGPAGAMIGKALGNMIGDAVGEAVNQAASQLQKEDGMPSFLKEEIEKIVKEELAKLRDDSVDCECQQRVDDATKDWKQDFVNDLTKAILDPARDAGDLGNKTKSQGSSGGGAGASGGAGESGAATEGGGTSEGSWLLAIASAMGEEAKKMVELSQQMKDVGGGSDGENAQKFSQLQATSQMFSMLENAFSTALKAIGEGLSAMARKQ